MIREQSETLSDEAFAQRFGDLLTSREWYGHLSRNAWRGATGPRPITCTRCGRTGPPDIGWKESVSEPRCYLCPYCHGHVIANRQRDDDEASPLVIHPSLRALADDPTAHPGIRAIARDVLRTLAEPK